MGPGEEGIEAVDALAGSNVVEDLLDERGEVLVLESPLPRAFGGPGAGGMREKTPGSSHWRT